MTTYTNLRAAPRLDLGASAPLSVPLTIYIEPSNRCNLSCNFCPQSLEDYEERSGGRMDIDMELYRKVIAEVSTFNPRPKSIKLYFLGEPLLHPEIKEIMSLAVSVCDRVEVTTNGYPLSERTAQAILDSGVHYLRVSVYTYEGIRTDLVHRNVVRLSTMRREQNKSTPFICAKVFSVQEKVAIREAYSPYVDEISSETLHSFASDLVSISEQRRNVHVACPYLFYTLVVKSNGDVVPCCVAWEDSLVVGNVKKESLIDIWRGDKLAEIHRSHLAGNRSKYAACKNCDTIYNSPDSVDSLTVDEYNRRRK